MGLFSFVGGLFGGGSQKKASRRAERAQIAAFQQGLDEQRRQFDLTRADYQPYMEAGTQALGQQGALLGLEGGDQQTAAIKALRQSPLYQSLFRNGMEAVTQSAAATGGLRGGNTQAAFADFGSDLLASTIERQLAQLGGISGRGQAAVGDVSQLGAMKAGNVANLLGQQGAARAGGLLTRGGINAGMWNNAGSFLDSIASSIPGLPGGLKKLF